MKKFSLVLGLSILAFFCLSISPSESSSGCQRIELVSPSFQGSSYINLSQVKRNCFFIFTRSPAYFQLTSTSSVFFRVYWGGQLFRSSRKYGKIYRLWLPRKGKYQFYLFGKGPTGLGMTLYGFKQENKTKSQSFEKHPTHLPERNSKALCQPLKLTKKSYVVFSFQPIRHVVCRSVMLSSAGTVSIRINKPTKVYFDIEGKIIQKRKRKRKFALIKIPRKMPLSLYFESKVPVKVALLFIRDKQGEISLKDKRDQSYKSSRPLIITKKPELKRKMRIGSRKKQVVSRKPRRSRVQQVARKERLLFFSACSEVLEEAKSLQQIKTGRELVLSRVIKTSFLWKGSKPISLYLTYCRNTQQTFFQLFAVLDSSTKLIPWGGKRFMKSSEPFHLKFDTALLHIFTGSEALSYRWAQVSFRNVSLQRKERPKLLGTVGVVASSRRLVGPSRNYSWSATMISYLFYSLMTVLLLFFFYQYMKSFIKRIKIERSLSESLFFDDVQCCDVSVFRLFWDLGADRESLHFLLSLQLLSPSEKRPKESLSWLKETIHSYSNYDTFINVFYPSLHIEKEKTERILEEEDLYNIVEKELGQALVQANQVSFEAITAQEIFDAAKEHISKEIRHEYFAIDELGGVEQVVGAYKIANFAMRSYSVYQQHGLSMDERLFRTAEDLATDLAQYKAQALGASIGATIGGSLAFDLDGNGMVDGWEAFAFGLAFGVIGSIVSGKFFSGIAKWWKLRHLRDAQSRYEQACSELAKHTLQGTGRSKFFGNMEKPISFWKNRFAKTASLVEYKKYVHPEEIDILKVLLDMALKAEKNSIRRLSGEKMRLVTQLHKLAKEQNWSQAGQIIAAHDTHLLQGVPRIDVYLQSIKENLQLLIKQIHVAKANGLLT